MGRGWEEAVVRGEKKLDGEDGEAKPRWEEGAEEAERCRAGGRDLVRNLGARAARQLLREGVRQDREHEVDGERQIRPE